MQNGTASSICPYGSWLVCHHRHFNAFCSALLLQVKTIRFKQLVDTATTANLATFWRDTTAGVFYHRRKVTLVGTIEELNDYLKTPEKPHWIIVTKELIPFLQLEAKQPNLKQVMARGKFALFNLDTPEGKQLHL
jgi:hypothetical protein